MSATTWPACSSDGSTGSAPASSPIPTGVAFTTRSALATSAAVPTRPLRPASPAAVAAACGVRLTTTTSAAPAVAEGEGEGPPRATGAEQHHPAPVRVGPRIPQRGEEAVAVGVEALERAVGPPPHGVDRLQARRRRRAAVDAHGHVGLVGHRDAEALDPERAHAGQRVAGVTGRHLEGEVHPVEPARLQGGVVHRRRQRVPHRRADHSCQAGLSGQAAHERAGYVACRASSSPLRRWPSWPPAAAPPTARCRRRRLRRARRAARLVGAGDASGRAP